MRISDGTFRTGAVVSCTVTLKLPSATLPLIVEGVLVGNPVMHHLMLAIDPKELGWAPFALATSDSLTLWASEIGLSMHPDGRIYVLPCIAGHVGADTAGVMLAEAPWTRDEVSLVIDVFQVAIGVHLQCCIRY